jgi:hypothetical protein
MSKIIILGGARDYHAMDWYRSVRKVVSDKEVLFLTDTIRAENFENIIKKDDIIEKLFIIDFLLFSHQSYMGNLWRNFVKILVLPVQIIKLRKFINAYPNCTVHAHPMYYMLLCKISGIEYIGTPQGSEILVRPNRSMIYKKISISLLKSANLITVDSQQMADVIKKMSGVKVKIVQYGINTKEILKIDTTKVRKYNIVSIRGIAPLYQINKIISYRDKCLKNYNIVFIYPFFDSNYFEHIKSRSQSNDQFIGRLDKNNMYNFLAESKLVLSIPVSDSSPRSVYEAIFLGCCVATVYNCWIDHLPLCMQKRIIQVDLSDECWLKKAISKAEEITREKFIPSKDAIQIFDEDISMSRVVNTIYNIA